MMASKKAAARVKTIRLATENGTQIETEAVDMH
ncbi:Uncharacterised protein [Pantoea agglomerans]|uniref:Uncharacterized protein n=1 Tax=Enterobacter agglomerans TaxID=549 RepID=A0A379AHL2_ENTAG|nr:Uncharacterised protein [Pantoea agglomerans]